MEPHDSTERKIFQLANLLVSTELPVRRMRSIGGQYTEKCGWRFATATEESSLRRTKDGRYK